MSVRLSTESLDIFCRSVIEIASAARFLLASDVPTLSDGASLAYQFGQVKVIRFKQIAFVITPLVALLWYFIPTTSPRYVDTALLRNADSFSLVLGTGKSRLYVFESVDCHYCAKLHPELMQLRDVTVHVLPLPGRSPRAKELAVGAWCALDRQAAWSAALDGIVQNTARCPADALDRNLALAKAMGLTATPAIIFEDGSLIQGYQSAVQMQDRLGK